MRRNLPLLVLALFVLSGLELAIAHNHLMFPPPRNPAAFYIGDNNCESNAANIPSSNTFKRNQLITPTWSYNNHHGGFVRFSIVPLGQERNGKPFNRRENIILYTCLGRSCGGKNPPLDGGDVIPCSITLRIPPHLPDGNYVLQWIMYSSYVAQGREDRGLPNYTSCANIRIRGGARNNERPGQCSFFWFGGDTEYQRGLQDRLAREVEEDTCCYFMRKTLGPSTDTVVTDEDFVLSGGRPVEVEDCLEKGQLKRSFPAIPDEDEENEGVHLDSGLKEDQIITLRYTSLGGGAAAGKQAAGGKNNGGKNNGKGGKQPAGKTAAPAAGGNGQFFLTQVNKKPVLVQGLRATASQWKVILNKDDSLSFQNVADNSFLFAHTLDGSIQLAPANGPELSGASWVVRKIGQTYTLRSGNKFENGKFSFLAAFTNGALTLAPENFGNNAGSRWAITILPPPPKRA